MKISYVNFGPGSNFMNFGPLGPNYVQEIGPGGPDFIGKILPSGLNLIAKIRPGVQIS